MSWKPGDMNHDGRVDYVDQKIFDTQVNPYSGEYQGKMPSSSSGSFFGPLGCLAGIVFGVLLLVFMIQEDPEFFILYLVILLAIVIIFTPIVIIRNKRLKKGSTGNNRENDTGSRLPADYAELEKIEILKADGLLTDEEYSKMKTDCMNKILNKTK